MLNTVYNAENLISPFFGDIWRRELKPPISVDTFFFNYGISIS